jgi:hypothetical protein
VVQDVEKRCTNDEGISEEVYVEDGWGMEG